MNRQEYMHNWYKSLPKERIQELRDYQKELYRKKHKDTKIYATDYIVCNKELNDVRAFKSHKELCEFFNRGYTAVKKKFETDRKINGYSISRRYETMKTTEEMIEIMKAFNSGKQIESYSLKEGSKWKDCESPNWNWTEFDYRLKEYKEHRPFYSVSEMLNKKSVGTNPVVWVREKNTNMYSLITYFDKDSDLVALSGDEFTKSLSELFDNYTNPDGSPFGVLM